MRKGLLMAVMAGATAMAPMTASAAVRGFVTVGPGFYGGWNSPYWGGYWGPYGGPYGYYANSGEVKLDTNVKTAEVFIDGAYAGTTHDNKTMRLRPGNYNIEIHENGKPVFGEKVFVVAGKTVHLRPQL